MQYEQYDFEQDEYEYYLKYISSLSNYISFYHYNGQDFLIKNIFLHIEFKELFQDINIFWVNPLIRDNILHWEINMEKIFYNKREFKNRALIELNPLFELIIGVNEYKNNITNDYFDSYINKEICSIIIIKDYQIFECQEDKFELNDIKKFPTLYMYNFDVEHTFNMTGEDLFLKIDNKYYFKIIFPLKDLNPNRWILGKIFFRKYPTIFSPTNRIIGFYINPNKGVINEDIDSDSNNESEDNNKNGEESRGKSNNAYIYILISVIAFIFLFLGIFIGKKIFFPRIRKANELDDDNFQYESKQLIN